MEMQKNSTLANREREMQRNLTLEKARRVCILAGVEEGKDV